MRPPEIANRRPLATRRAAWPHRIARALAEAGVTANQVSVASTVVAAAGAAALGASVDAAGGRRVAWLIAAAVGIQLRLVCNLLDGLIAVENHRKSTVGDVYNDAPDRVADVLLLVAAGYATGHAWGPTLGWVAAVGAVGTAYLRLLGASLGLPHDYCGPFAKPQRMAALTAGCLLTLAEPWWGEGRGVLLVTVAVVAVGTLATVVRRLRRLLRALECRR